MSGRVLVMASQEVPQVVLSPLVASLSVLDMDVALAVTSGADRSGSTVEKVWRAITGELGERRAEKAWEEKKPDVAVVFDPQSARFAESKRTESGSDTIIVGIVPSLTVDSGWASTSCERYLTFDDEAAVDLAAHGVDGENIMSIGFFAEYAFAAAASESRAAVRSRLNLPSGPIAVVEVEGFGYERTAQLATQLALMSEANCLYMFDAGDDSDAAAALRRVVPTLDMKAKLFGAKGDTPVYWRACDVVVGPASVESAYRALMVGARFVPIDPTSDADKQLSLSLATRGIGHPAQNALLAATSLQSAFSAGPIANSEDGARNAAAVIWVMAEEGGAVAEAARAEDDEATAARVKEVVAAVEAYARAAGAAGELEDLSSPKKRAPANVALPSKNEIQRLQASVRTRMNHAGKVVFSARENSMQWENRAAQAKAKGDEVARKEATAKADVERNRMHKALAEMAQLEKELKALERAAREVERAPEAVRSQASGPRATQTRTQSSKKSTEEMLEELKRRSAAGDARRDSGSGTTANSGRSNQARRKKKKKNSVEDELAALKRKMSRKK